MPDSISDPNSNHVKLMFILSNDQYKIFFVIKKKPHVIELTSPVLLGQQPPLRLLICDRTQSHIGNFGRIRFNPFIWTKLMTAEANFLFVNREPHPRKYSKIGYRSASRFQL
jgi:hypothetical protein